MPANGFSNLSEPWSLDKITLIYLYMPMSHWLFSQKKLHPTCLTGLLNVPLSDHSTQYSAKKIRFLLILFFLSLLLFFVFLSFFCVMLFFCIQFVVCIPFFLFENFSRNIFSNHTLSKFYGKFFLDVTFDKLEFCWDLRAVAWDFLISFLIHTDRHFLERLLSVLLENLFLRGCFYVCINLLLIVICLKIFGDLVRSAN